MKRTRVAPGGDVVCPRCGARNQFVSKRTGKAKVAGAVLAGPVGLAVMPKRLKCSGCGTNLKRGRAPQPSAPKWSEIDAGVKVILGVFALLVIAVMIIGATH